MTSLPFQSILSSIKYVLKSFDEYAKVVRAMVKGRIMVENAQQNLLMKLNNFGVM